MDAALTQLDQNNGLMTERGLTGVLKRGLEYREANYEDRVGALDTLPLMCLTRVLSTCATRDGVQKEVFVASLMGHNDKEDALGLFYVALETGVLAKQGNECSVPIPSMHNRLLSSYLYPPSPAP